MAAEPSDFRNGRHVVYRLHVHVVLVTKYRRGVITGRVRELLIATAREVCERHDTTLVEADGEHDHLHLLIDYPPKLALSTLVGAIKSNSSRRVREQNWPEVRKALWGQHFWSPSYCVLSTGGATIDIVKAYITTQRTPNRHPGRPAANPALTGQACAAE
jgi:putative transposase